MEEICLISRATKNTFLLLKNSAINIFCEFIAKSKKKSLSPMKYFD